MTIEAVGASTERKPELLGQTVVVIGGSAGKPRELLEQAPDGSVPEPAWTGMRRMRVAAIDRESTTVISVHLVPLDGEPAVPAGPGSS